MSSDEAFLDVHVPIAALEDSKVDPEAVSLQLLDTPGPNEAGEESLKFQVCAHDKRQSNCASLSNLFKHCASIGPTGRAPSGQRGCRHLHP